MVGISYPLNKGQKMKISSFFCRINDRVISANNISLEGVDYAGAVQVLRDSGQTVNLVVKRRVVLPNANAASSGLGEQTIRYAMTMENE